MVNIRYLNNGVTNYTRHTVMVLSAGPNGLFDTPYRDNVYDEEVGGDDVGYIIRSSEPQ